MLASGCSKYWSRLSSGMACMTQMRAGVEGVQAGLDAVTKSSSRRASRGYATSQYSLSVIGCSKGSSRGSSEPPESKPLHLH